MTDEKARALRAARKGRAALAELKTRDAAWFGLLALDLDPECTLAWALLAHILTEATQDPVATWAMHNALAVGLPEQDHGVLARFHRVDLWARGLLAHESGRAVLDGAELDAPDGFRITPRLEPWLEATSSNWGGAQGVLRALQRMAAALSDAWSVPMAEDALRDDVAWPKKPEFAAWVDGDPIGDAPPPAPPAPTGLTEDLRLLSDYWMEQEVAELGAQGRFDLALEHAQTWSDMRPAGLSPKIAMLRLHAARGDEAAKQAAAEEIAEHEPATLEGREEARIAFAELELWQPQVGLLDRMLEEAPGHPIILTNRGVAKLKIGDEVGAATDLEAALATTPDAAPALANLALVRMRQDEYGEAKRLLERAAEIAPEEADVLVYLAVCKNNQGDDKGAAADLRRALEIAPEHAEAARLLSEIGA